MCQDNGPVHEVSENSHELAVVALLELFPAEIIVLGLRRIGREDISHDILFSREFLQIFVCPYSPILGRRNLVSFEIQELIGRDIVRKDISVAVCFQH